MKTINKVIMMLALCTSINSFSMSFIKDFARSRYAKLQEYKDHSPSITQPTTIVAGFLIYQVARNYNSIAKLCYHLIFTEDSEAKQVHNDHQKETAMTAARYLIYNKKNQNPLLNEETRYNKIKNAQQTNMPDWKTVQKVITEFEKLSPNSTLEEALIKCQNEANSGVEQDIALLFKTHKEKNTGKTSPLKRSEEWRERNQGLIKFFNIDIDIN